MRLRSEPGAVERERRVDERALRRILREHHSLVYSIVFGVLQDRDDAEDAVQSVFMRIWRGLPDFRGDSKLSTWIYRIARNEALDALARRRPDRVPLEQCEDLRSSAAGPDDALAAGDSTRLLDRALGRLEEPQRIALDLRYRAEKSYEEIAGIMDLPVGTVKTHIHRGKIALRRILSRGAAAAPARGSGDV